MKRLVYEEDFIQDLITDDYACWSRDGAKALFDYLTQLEEDIGEELNFNRTDLRCEYSEYKTLGDCLEEYSDIKTLDELENYTTVIKVHDYKNTDTGRIIIGINF